MDLVVWILVSSLIGARAAYILFHLDEFSGRWIDIVNPIQSDGTIGIAGLVFLGGVLLAVPVAWLYMRQKKLSFPQITDIMAPGLALGAGVARIGCFLNGCCFGHPTDLPWGIIFPTTCYAGWIYQNQAIHPTQVYAILYNLAIASILIAWTPRRRFKGEIFALFLLLYGIARILIETVRYYQDSMIPLHIGSFSITISMIISFIMSVIGLLVIINGYLKVKKDHETG